MDAATTDLVLTTEAPVKRAPECTRELFLRPPDWRYQEASSYLRAVKQRKTPVIPSDPFVQYAIRILRANGSSSAAVYFRSMWQEASGVLFLGTVMKRSAIVAEIEANLLHGITAQQLVEQGFYVPPTVYALYGKLFFDLSGITAIHSWINDFLFEPERHQRNSTLLRGRLLAYYQGVDRIHEATVTGTPLTDDTKELMKTMASSERQRKVFDYMIKETRLDAETYVAMMETAVKSMTERDFQERMRDREDAGSSSLDELAQNLEQGIRGYSQQELEQADVNGLDFNNQFVAGILRKDNDNGKSNNTN